MEIIITHLTGAWKLVYRNDGIMPPGFYSKNAGDPTTYVPASENAIALQALLAAVQDDAAHAACQAIIEAR